MGDFEAITVDYAKIELAATLPGTARHLYLRYWRSGQERQHAGARRQGRLAGLAAIFEHFSGLRLVPSKRRSLAPPTSGYPFREERFLGTGRKPLGVRVKCKCKSKEKFRSHLYK
jgi:hypothetical protein